MAVRPWALPLVAACCRHLIKDITEPRPKEAVQRPGFPTPEFRKSPATKRNHLVDVNDLHAVRLFRGSLVLVPLSPEATESGQLVLLPGDVITFPKRQATLVCYIFRRRNSRGRRSERIHA